MEAMWHDLHFTESSKPKTREGKGTCPRSGTAICFDCLSRHPTTHTDSSGNWGKSCPTKFWNKVSFKCQWQPPSFLLFRKYSSELVIRRHRLRVKEYNFSHVSKPGVIGHPLPGERWYLWYHEIQTSHELFVKSWLLENKPKVEESKIHNYVLIAWVCWTEWAWDCISETIHGKEGCTVSQQRETRKERNFCLAFLGPGSVCEWQSQDLNLNSMKFKTQVISQWAKQMSQFQPTPGRLTSKPVLQQGDCSLHCQELCTGPGERPQHQGTWCEGWNCRTDSRWTGHHSTGSQFSWTNICRHLHHTIIQTD